jgi:hypothetical protein
VDSFNADDLWSQGYSKAGRVLTAKECAEIRAMYDDTALFRSRIDMQRYRFGSGEYQYFSYPLPSLIAKLRKSMYRVLAPIAGEWMAALSLPASYPDGLETFLERCHAAGQCRPTPLILRYGVGDYNCLHQDIYGAIVFPFQVVTALSHSGTDFTGGELLLVEQQPRAQSIGRVVQLEQGEAVIITTRYRPVKGSRGYYRTNMRHGVSPILSGKRYTLGLIFHDSE